jgi:hypothetical protein
VDPKGVHFAGITEDTDPDVDIDSPSTVVIAQPSSESKGHKHEFTDMRTSSPSSFVLEIATVHAPQPPSPQPIFADLKHVFVRRKSFKEYDQTLFKTSPVRCSFSPFKAITIPSVIIVKIYFIFTHFKENGVRG